MHPPHSMRLSTAHSAHSELGGASASDRTILTRVREQDETLRALVLTPTDLQFSAAHASEDANRERRGDGIGDAGDERELAAAQELAAALDGNHVITSLQLSGLSVAATMALLVGAGVVRQEALAASENSALLTSASLPCTTGISAGALRTLCLEGEAVCDVVCAAIAEGLRTNSALRELRLDGKVCGLVSDLTAATIAAALKTNRTLHTLKIAGALCHVGRNTSAATAEALRANTTLKSLVLAGTFLDDTAGAEIAEAVEFNGTMEALHLAGRGFGNQFAVQLKRSLSKNVALRSIALEDHFMSDATGVAVADAIGAGKAVVSVQLICASMGDSTGIAMARLLRKSNTLRSLQIDGLHLSDETFVAIAEALQTNSVLHLLCLQNPLLDLGDKAAVAISRALRVNDTLRSLHVVCGSIDDASGAAVCEALLENGTLVALRLDGEGLGGVTMAVVEAALSRTNVALQTLHLKSYLLNFGKGFAPVDAAGHSLPPDLPMTIDEAAGGGDCGEVARVYRTEQALRTALIASIQTALERNRELPANWRNLVWLVQNCASPGLSRVVDAMGERGLRSAVFSFLAPPDAAAAEAARRRRRRLEAALGNTAPEPH
mmetsp:Transcript_42809/g.118273  ORF Transcript_42809/g.118273 Transcript_42809/m.118273 type:complete len:608 (-) Transcript_42809:50-1873(-)